MPSFGWRGAAKVLWRARHLIADPWEELEKLFLAFRIGIAALVAVPLTFGLALLALLVALLIEPWRAWALWGALVLALLAVAALALAVRLLLFTLPRRLRALLAWLQDAPSNVRGGADELRAIVAQVEREERAGGPRR